MSALKEFELTIPHEYMDHINKEIKKPKRPNTERLELWLERELNVENPGTYGNLPVDESHVVTISCQTETTKSYFQTSASV